MKPIEIEIAVDAVSTGHGMRLSTWLASIVGTNAMGESVRIQAECLDRGDLPKVGEKVIVTVSTVDRSTQQ